MERKQGIDWTVGLMNTVALVAAFVWLIFAWDLPDTVQTLALLMLLTAFVGIAIFDNIRRDRRRDEMELAASRFGARWALLASIILPAMAFMPPVTSLLARLGEELVHSGNSHLPATVKMFVLGVCASVVVQQLAAQTLSRLWTLSKR